LLRLIFNKHLQIKKFGEADRTRPEGNGGK